jgi:1,2-phenylacetyl-CoA epoxidase catalytic subunit
VNATTADAGTLALARLVALLADSKYLLGRHLAEWAVGAPALESAVACAAVAQEELGHTRVLSALLEQLPGAPAPLESDPEREPKYCAAFLREPFPSWVDAVARLFLSEAAMTVVLEELASCADDALRRRAARMLDDEPIHRKYAEGRVRELGLGPWHDALAARVEELLPAALDPLDPLSQEDREALGAHGLLGVGSNELRQAILSKVGPVLDEVGIVTCVWCGSVDTERLGEFGPGVMTEQWFCRACKSPFERVRKRGDL